MSRGTRIVPIRIPDLLVEDLKILIEERNSRSPLEPWTFSEFVRIALTEKMDKMRRSRGRKGGVIHPSEYYPNAEESAKSKEGEADSN